jgi:hypothetical protein
MSSPRLTRPIKPINRTLALYTIDEACAYLISLPDRVAGMQAWECAADLAVKARENPTHAMLDDFTRQLELALFVTDRLDLTVGHTKISSLLDRARGQVRDEPSRPRRVAIDLDVARRGSRDR